MMFDRKCSTLRIASALTMLGLVVTTNASACGDSSYVGAICMTAASYCPSGTIPADGRELPIAQYTALYSLLGVTYGGNGTTTFNVPNLQGKTPVGFGPSYTQGASGGTEVVTLNESQMPAHTHIATTTVTIKGQNSAADAAEPSNTVLADPQETQQGSRNIYSTLAPNVSMSPSAAAATTQIATTGSGSPFDNRSPYLVVRYCVVNAGLYPSRD